MHSPAADDDSSSSEQVRRALAALGLGLGLVYVLWRTTTLGTGPGLVLAGIVLLTEVWSLTELTLLTIQGWRQPSSPPNQAATGSEAGPEPPAVDVIITAHGHDGADVERSLLGATALAGRSRTIVLDAEPRAEVAAALEPFPATYLVDPTITVNAAAGAMAHTRTERYLWLEAGQVPMPDAIRVLGRHLDHDPRVAVAQSAVGLLNAESLMHLRGGRDDDALTRNVTGPGSSRLGVGPWTGPGSLVRRAALTDIGGLPETETSALAVGRAEARLHRAGWKTAYDGARVVRATAAETMGRYLADRRTRARTAFGLYLTPESPLRGRLPLLTRLAVVGRITPHLTGLRLLIQLAALLVVLLTGHLPFDAPARTVVAAWAVVSVGATTARWALGRRSMVLGDFVRTGWRTAEADLLALGDAIHHRRTEPGRVRPVTGLAALGQLHLVTGATVAVELALLGRASTLVWPDALPALGTLDRMVVLGITLVNLAVLVDVLRLVVLGRQRRKHHRIQTELPAWLNGREVLVIDVSPAGMGLLAPSAPPVGARIRIELELPSLDGTPQRIASDALVRAATPSPSGQVRIGVELSEIDTITRLILSAFCVLGRAVPTDPGRGLLLAPDQLSIERARTRHHGLQVTTGLAALAGLAVFLGGPSASTALATATPPELVCALDASGAPIVGAEVAVGRPQADGSTIWDDLGPVGIDGCRAVLGATPTDTIAVSLATNRVEAEAGDHVDGRLALRLNDRRVAVIDRAGALVPVSVRHHTEEWVELTAQAPVAVLPSATPVEEIEITLDGVRHVTPMAEGDLVLRLSTLVADPGAAPTEIDRGAGWEPFPSGLEILPGPVVIRTADGGVAKLDIAAGHEVQVPSGIHTPLPPVTTPADLVPTTSTPAPRSTTAPAPTPDPTAAPTSTSTSTSSSAPTSTTNVTATPPPTSPSTTDGEHTETTVGSDGDGGRP